MADIVNPPATDRKASLPFWITAIVIFEALPMFLGPVGALYSNGVFEDASALTLPNLIYLGRNLAVGIALIVALRLKSPPMLFILILVRLITDLIDLPALLYFSDGTYTVLLIGAFVTFYYIPAFFALRYLWRMMENGAARSSEDPRNGNNPK